MKMNDYVNIVQDHEHRVQIIFNAFLINNLNYSFLGHFFSDKENSIRKFEKFESAF
jgi:hypothetical protein